MQPFVRLASVPLLVAGPLLVLGAGLAAGATRRSADAFAAERADEPGAPRAESPETLWDDLLEGNRRFARGAVEPRAVLLKRNKLAAGQRPRVALLGCSDSRVPPEIVFDKSLGDLFVVRTAGNVADPVALGSLEYAVESLRTSLLVVLGHERCGAVAAAQSGDRMASSHLQAIVARIAPALEKPAPGVAPEIHSLRNVEANVRRTADVLLQESAILERAVKRGDLRVVRALYRLASGEVERLH